MRGRRPLAWVGAPAAAVLALGLVSAPSAMGSPPHRICRNITVTTGLSAKAPQQLHLFGRWCRPARSRPTTIQVLVHGGTYSHTYWDFPGFGQRYSYAGYMNRHGYATLAIDLLGVGASSHPPSTDVTIKAEAYAVHSAIQAARHGRFGPHYRRVVLVGHSLGTLTDDIEAATYHDEDGFIATGTSHGPGLTGLAQVFARVEPALLDPVTAPQIPAGDFGYLSTPGARTVFYEGGAVNPAVKRADEATRSPVPAGFASTLLPYVAATPLLDTPAITAPVLLVNGREDAVFCEQGGGGATTTCASSAALKQAERPDYGRAAHLATYVLPNSGHDINLVPNARLWYARALAWCRHHVPASEKRTTP